MAGMDKTSAEKVYREFRDNLDGCRSSYLYGHYRRGEQGIMRPDRSQVAATAAWRAGRDAPQEA